MPWRLAGRRADRRRAATSAKAAAEQCPPPAARIKARLRDVGGSIRDFVRKHAGVRLRDNGGAKRALGYVAGPSA
ncbi:MAG: hypothetical protein N2689_04750 [Verrucomicrobiae bacterium]|nr:hypothetical protein [Verrucomicrobiae bacterium]